MNEYFEKRKHESYYKYVRSLLGILAYNAQSVCDVGSNGTDMISWLPCQEKVRIDLREPLYADGVQSIQADFITYDFSRKFDIVTCFQVLEHISDEQIRNFANKLLETAEHLLIVSVPYMWAEGACKWHVQDPVDESKFLGWFDIQSSLLKPVFSRIIYSNKKFRNGTPIARLVVVFASKYIADNLDSLNGSDNWLIRYK